MGQQPQRRWCNTSERSILLIIKTLTAIHGNLLKIVNILLQSSYISHLHRYRGWGLARYSLAGHFREILCLEEST